MTLAFVGLAVLPPYSPAQAECVQSGNTVRCSGSDNDGFDAGAQDGLNVEVQSGASVAVGDGAVSILLNDNNTATNNGTVSGGIASTGFVAGVNNTITNNGTVRTGAFGVGIEADSGNTVRNNAMIAVGAGGAGVLFLTDGNVLNNFGTIRSIGDGFSVETCVCTAFNNTINNFGTLDGRLEILGTDQTVNNRGLITITDSASGTPIGVGFTHTVQNTTGAGGANTFNQFSSGTLALRMTNTGAIDNLLADVINPGGRLRVLVQPGLYPSQVVSGIALSVTPPGPITAPFDSYVSSSPFFRVTPLYTGGAGTPTDYTDLSVQLDRIAFDAVDDLTPNQQRISSVLERGYSDTLTGDAATFYANLLAAANVSVFDALSGEGTSVTQGTAFGAGTLFQSTLLDQIRLWLSNPAFFGAGAPLAYASVQTAPHPAFSGLVRPSRTPAARAWHAWASGFGGAREIDGDAAAGTADLSQHGAGAAVGVSYVPSADLLVGISAGGSGSSFSVPDRATDGNVHGLHTGVYGIKTWNALYAAATLSYSRFENETTRTISGAGAAETATGDFSSDLLTGRVELGWRSELGAYTATPFLALQAAQLWQRGYSETSTTAGGGSGVLGLSYQAVSAASLPLSVGVQWDSSIELENGRTLHPFARLAWVREFKPTREIEAAFITVPSASFTAEGPRAAENAVQINTGARLHLSRFAALFANFDGEFSNNSRGYSGSGGFSFSW